MSKELAVLVTVVAGGFVAVQAPANNVLSKSVGTFGAASVNFIVGTICVLLVTFAFAGGFAGDEGAQSPPWYYWLVGGLGGVAIVVSTLVAVRELGAGGVTAAVIAGQLTLSVVLDRLGVLGLDERAVTWEKVLGIALLAAGTVLIVRE
ncbi:MAG TPA: DMT family transporter [Thermoleophilaceae bacterium]|nr:DMT family transporter [Thermoleophilaceae bacterium]